MERKVKLTVAISRPLIERYDALAARYGLSRAAVLRCGLERGYSPAVAWCGRSVALLDREAAADAAAVDELARGLARSESSSVDAVPAPTVDPEDQLRTYAARVVTESPEISREDFASSLRAQVAVLGIAPTAGRLVVADLVAEYFPADGGDRGGKVVPVPVGPDGLVDLD